MTTVFAGTAVVRNRMPGGVRGRREQSRLLLDRSSLPGMVFRLTVLIQPLRTCRFLSGIRKFYTPCNLGNSVVNSRFKQSTGVCYFCG